MPFKLIVGEWSPSVQKVIRMAFPEAEFEIYPYRDGDEFEQAPSRISPDAILLNDPPCLRGIDTRISEGNLHFIGYFRSWDLWNGFPANLGAIQLLKAYMAAEIGVGDGEIIAASKGLHLYHYVWELAECLRGKTIEEFRSGQ